MAKFCNENINKSKKEKCLLSELNKSNPDSRGRDNKDVRKIRKREQRCHLYLITYKPINNKSLKEMFSSDSSST